MENLNYALQNDPRAKAWICPNTPLFVNSHTHQDMFLTTYRFRNAYEDLLSRLEEGQFISDERDWTLIQRWFDMSFYPPKSLSLTAWSEGKDDRVRILRAYKDRRWKGNRRRPHEITLELDNGKTYQINPNKILGRYWTITQGFQALKDSAL
jgi:hypothetical protein